MNKKHIEEYLYNLFQKKITVPASTKKRILEVCQSLETAKPSSENA